MSINSEWVTVRHAVIERAVGKWCQRLPLVFLLQVDILSTCFNENDVV